MTAASDSDLTQMWAPLSLESPQSLLQQCLAIVSTLPDASVLGVARLWFPTREGLHSQSPDELRQSLTQALQELIRARSIRHQAAEDLRSLRGSEGPVERSLVRAFDSIAALSDQMASVSRVLHELAQRSDRPAARFVGHEDAGSDKVLNSVPQLLGSLLRATTAIPQHFTDLIEPSKWCETPVSHDTFQRLLSTYRAPAEINAVINAEPSVSSKITGSMEYRDLDPIIRDLSRTVELLIAIAVTVFKDEASFSPAATDLMRMISHLGGALNAFRRTWLIPAEFKRDHPSTPMTAEAVSRLVNLRKEYAWSQRSPGAKVTPSSLLSRLEQQRVSDKTLAASLGVRLSTQSKQTSATGGDRRGRSRSRSPRPRTGGRSASPAAPSGGSRPPRRSRSPATQPHSKTGAKSSGAPSGR